MASALLVAQPGPSRWFESSILPDKSCYARRLGSPADGPGALPLVPACQAMAREALGGQGSVTYLLDLWGQRSNTAAEQRVLPRHCRPAVLRRHGHLFNHCSRGEDPILGFDPYLNGGLFLRNALEDRVERSTACSRFPDEVFDPANDDSLLGLLNRYRFTTRESTPDDHVRWTRTRSCWGACSRTSTRATSFCNTGTYYTPREMRPLHVPRNPGRLPVATSPAWTRERSNPCAG